MAADVKLSDDKLLALIRLIYETAEDASLWTVLLQRLADLLGATVATLDLYDLAKKQGDVQASINISPEFTERYKLYFSTRNIWLQHRQDLVIPGRAVLGQMLVPDAVMLKSEFYQDFLRHEEIFHLTGLRILEKGSLAAHLSLMRPRRFESFEMTALSFLDILVPHLQQAMRLHQRIIDAEACGGSLAETLDRMPVGVILVDSSAHVLMMNKAACEIVRARDGLMVGLDGLEADCHRETTALRNLISAAAATIRGNGLQPGGALRISRPSLARSFTVQVIPLSARSRSFGVSRPAVAVFVSDPEARPTVAHLTSLYHLTPAEEAVALRLVQGLSLAEAGEELAITLNTARTHLKRIFPQDRDPTAVGPDANPAPRRDRAETCVTNLSRPQHLSPLPGITQMGDDPAPEERFNGECAPGWRQRSPTWLATPRQEHSSKATTTLSSRSSST